MQAYRQKLVSVLRWQLDTSIVWFPCNARNHGTLPGWSNPYLSISRTGICGAICHIIYFPTDSVWLQVCLFLLKNALQQVMKMYFTRLSRCLDVVHKRFLLQCWRKRHAWLQVSGACPNTAARNTIICQIAIDRSIPEYGLSNMINNSDRNMPDCNSSMLVRIEEPHLCSAFVISLTGLIQSLCRKAERLCMIALFWPQY